MQAAKIGNLSAVKFLLESGADPKRRNSNGNNSIALARIAKQNETANYIESYQKKHNLLNFF
jgi:ankyrin repeat protein